MNHESMAHGALTMSKSFAASPRQVFAAWSDPELRRQWGTPSEDVELQILEADFSVGGRDLSHCVYAGEVVAVVSGRYHDIVPERRIVYTETIATLSSVEGVCLVSAELLPRGSGTELVLTLQTVALDGADVLAGVQQGWSAALSALERLLSA